MSRARFAIAVLALTSACPVHAAEFSAGYLHWDHQISGTAQTSDRRLDLERDLDVRARNQSLFLLRWDTGPGAWPDLVASYFRLKADGRGGAEQESGGLLGGVLPAADAGSASAQADLRDLELTLRYPWRLGEDAAVSLGLTVKQLRGEISVRDENDSETTREHIEQAFPMAHLLLAGRPAPWLDLEASADYVSYGGDRAYGCRLQGAAHWGPLVLHAGWQARGYQVTAGGYRLDSRLAGPVFGLGLALP